MATATQTKVTRDDLERRLRALQDGLQGKVEDRKQSLVTTGAGIGFVLLLIVFLLGKRSGRKKTTLVEIRRL
jgi:hypothetical protein